MALNKANLTPGDVVLIKWPPGWHSAITVPTPAQAGPGVYLAHCEGPDSGTVIQEFDKVILNSLASDRHGFRRTGPAGVSTLAANYAAGWSTIPTQQSAFGSGYGSLPKSADVKDASRAMGVVRAIGTNPPFEFDALYRVFKWTSRADTQKVFSQNRGTTCCAFVMACHQAARMHKFFEKLGRLDLIPLMTTELLKGRGKEKELPNATKVGEQTFYPGQGLRANSNQQSKSAALNNEIATSGIDGFWERMGKKTNCYWDDTLLSIFGAALYHDAKYVHSQDFYTYVQNDNTWTSV